MTQKAFMGEALLALAVLGALLLSCADDDGVVTGVIGVQAVRERDGQRAPDLPADACERVPVLIGGKRSLSFPIEEPLRLELELDRDEARVRFTGAAGEVPTHLLDREEWEAGRSFLVESRSGETWVVMLSGECPATHDQ